MAIGTGFFAAQGIVMSAKHLFVPVVERGQYFIVFVLEDQTIATRRVAGITVDSTADIAVLWVADGANFPLVPTLWVEEDLPPPGAKIRAVCYPGGQLVSEGEGSFLLLWPRSFTGEVVEHFPEGRDRVMLPGPCIRTTLVLHGGSSGGPVYDLGSGHVIAVATTSFGDEPDSFVTPASCALDLGIPLALTESWEVSEHTSLRDRIAIEMQRSRSPAR